MRSVLGATSAREAWRKAFGSFTSLAACVSMAASSMPIPRRAEVGSLRTRSESEACEDAPPVLPSRCALIFSRSFLRCSCLSISPAHVVGNLNIFDRHQTNEGPKKITSPCT